MPNKLLHMTQGPGTMVVCPPGFLVAEQTMSSTATGLRKTILTLSLDRVLDMNSHRAKPHVVVEALKE
eukprot:5623530-Lingulodinium_polyedra.AAC.1